MKSEQKEKMQADLAEYDSKVRECFDKIKALDENDNESYRTIIREAREWASKANKIIKVLSKTDSEFYQTKWDF